MFFVKSRVKPRILGRRQALDKGEVQPTPAFRLLRVGAELCVNEERRTGLSGRYCIFGLFCTAGVTAALRTHERAPASPRRFTFPKYFNGIRPLSTGTKFRLRSSKPESAVAVRIFIVSPLWAGMKPNDVSLGHATQVPVPKTAKSSDYPRNRAPG